MFTSPEETTAFDKKNYVFSKEFAAPDLLRKRLNILFQFLHQIHGKIFIVKGNIQTDEQSILEPYVSEKVNLGLQKYTFHMFRKKVIFLQKFIIVHMCTCERKSPFRVYFLKSSSRGCLPASAEFFNFG